MNGSHRCRYVRAIRVLSQGDSIRDGMLPCRNEAASESSLGDENSQVSELPLMRPPFVTADTAVVEDEPCQASLLYLASTPAVAFNAMDEKLSVINPNCAWVQTFGSERQTLYDYLGNTYATALHIWVEEKAAEARLHKYDPSAASHIFERTFHMPAHEERKFSAKIALTLLKPADFYYLASGCYAAILSAESIVLKESSSTTVEARASGQNHSLQIRTQLGAIDESDGSECSRRNKSASNRRHAPGKRGPAKVTGDSTRITF